ncbi:hypothetical protein EUS_08570 [[Eubacterium] siraeum 70/3]|uniref:Uncharacterized protein n=1 Tax=[Eubacterium] siraeum 70/3 TaxID=657319 RepID=D4JSM4_9FIRM|nr:hypothetical protein EUS_08570 [[Eubacterium] siraeum 70/3]
MLLQPGNVRIKRKRFIDIAINPGKSYNVNYMAIICERTVESP